jgi:hypothetical protein
MCKSDQETVQYIVDTDSKEFHIILAVPGHALLWPFPVTD